MWSQIKKSHVNVVYNEQVSNEQVSNEQVSIVCAPSEPKTIRKKAL